MGTAALELSAKKQAFFLSNLQLGGKLNGYLADIDRQAEEVFNELVKKYAKTLGVTEQLKAENRMKWVSLMNNICACATETVNRDIIYA